MTTAVTRSAARLLLIPTFLIAFAIMFKGYADVGDGFSAGVIAALGVVLQLIAFGPEELDRLPLVRYAPIGTFLGLAVALVTIFVPPLYGNTIFEHVPGSGESVIYFGTIEFITPVLFDVGVFLVVFGVIVGIVDAIARANARLVRDREREGARLRDGEGPHDASVDGGPVE